MILISPSIALLLNRKFTHSRKCLEVPIREKLDSRNIWRIQYSVWKWRKIKKKTTGFRLTSTHHYFLRRVTIWWLPEPSRHMFPQCSFASSCTFPVPAQSRWSSVGYCACWRDQPFDQGELWKNKDQKKCICYMLFYVSILGEEIKKKIPGENSEIYIIHWQPEGSQLHKLDTEMPPFGYYG